MMRKSFLCLLMFIAALSFTITGCKPAEPEMIESQFEGVMDIDYSAWEVGRAGGELVVTQVSDPKTLNTITAEETTTHEITNLVFDFIVERDILTLDWSPVLVESWEFASDGLSATFTMRKGLKWSDGEPLTADDVVFAINEIYLKEEVEGSWRDTMYVGDELASVSLIDESTFKLTIPTTYADMIGLMEMPIVPKHIFEPLIKEKGIAAVNSFWGVDADVKTVIGSGPFKFEEYVPNQRIVLTKNPNYWKKDEKGRKLPYLDKVTVLIVEDQDAELLKFQSGEIDYYDMRGQDYATLIGQKEEVGFEIFTAGPDLGTNFVTFNQNPIDGEGDNGIEGPKLAWFSEQKFRRAVAHLIDRQTIIDNVLFGFGYHQYSFVPRFLPLYWDGVDDAAYKYDPAKAVQLLEEIGMTDRDGDGFREDKDGNKVTFLFETNSNNTDRVKYGEIISQDMKKAGLDVTYRPGDFNTLVGKLVSSYDWDLILIGLTGGPAPFLSGSSNYPSRGSLHMIEPGQESPRRDWEKRFDELYIENTTTLDWDTRKRTGDEMQKIWAEELPWTYTVNRALLYAFDANLGNTKARGFYPYRKAWGIIEYLYFRK